MRASVARPATAPPSSAKKKKVQRSSSRADAVVDVSETQTSLGAITSSTFSPDADPESPRSGSAIVRKKIDDLTAAISQPRAATRLDRRVHAALNSPVDARVTARQLQAAAAREAHARGVLASESAAFTPVADMPKPVLRPFVPRAARVSTACISAKKTAKFGTAPAPPHPSKKISEGSNVVVTDHLPRPYWRAERDYEAARRERDAALTAHGGRDPNPESRPGPMPPAAATSTAAAAATCAADADVPRPECDDSLQ